MRIVGRSLMLLVPVLLVSMGLAAGDWIATPSAEAGCGSPPPPPPPPPPPATMPPTGGPVMPPKTPGPMTPGPGITNGGGPITRGPGQQGVTGRRFRRSGAAARTGLSGQQDTSTLWRTWWSLEQDAWRTAPVAGGVATPVGNTDPLQGGIEGASLPVLLRLTDPARKESEGIRHAALLGLGRICQDTQAVDRLMLWVDAAKQPNALRATAAVALGMLRRDAPEAAFDAATLDRVRTTLMAHLGNTGSLGASAALALGLLGDQPFGTGIQKNGRLVGHKLWTHILSTERESATLPLFFALGLQPAAGIPQGVRTHLKDMVLKGRADRRTWGETARAQALGALLALDPVGADALLTRILGSRAMPAALRQAAWHGVGRIAPHLPAARRAQLGNVLLQTEDAAEGTVEQGLVLIARAHLIRADVAAGPDRAVRGKAGPNGLLIAAEKARGDVRPFAAMALGIVLSAREATTEHIGTWRKRALAFLVDGLEGAEALAHEVRSAHALAMGLSQDAKVRVPLRRLLVNAKMAPTVRADAALALTYARDTSLETRKALFSLVAASKDDIVGVEAANALATLAPEMARTRLMTDLRNDGEGLHRIETSLALAGGMDKVGVPQLLTWLGDSHDFEIRRRVSLAAIIAAARGTRTCDFGRFAARPDAPGPAAVLLEIHQGF